MIYPGFPKSFKFGDFIEEYSFDLRVNHRSSDSMFRFQSVQMGGFPGRCDSLLHSCGDLQE